MSFPTKILTMLRMGMEVAAKTSPSQPEHVAWVYVQPLSESKNGYRIGQLTVPVSATSQGGYLNGDRPVIHGFLIRHVECHVDRATNLYEGKSDSITGATTYDDFFIVANEEELESLLRQWVEDFTTFHNPQAVGYWFEENNDLIEEIRNRHINVRGKE